MYDGHYRTVFFMYVGVLLAEQCTKIGFLHTLDPAEYSFCQRPQKKKNIFQFSGRNMSNLS